MDFFMLCDKIKSMKQYDVIIIGAGAAGLAAAAQVIANGKTVAVFDMGATPARKVMVSGGGRCNLTNTAARFDRYFGKNPNFVRGALSRVSPNDILDWASEHNLKLSEKTPGRFFCDDGAGAVVTALMQDASGADFVFNTKIQSVKKTGGYFVVNNRAAKSLIVATGGISFSNLGVSDSGYKIAMDFGHTIVPVKPGLCALDLEYFPSEMAGISLNAKITVGKNSLCDSLLFTHLGIGGPAAYRASLFDIENNDMTINLVPGVDLLQQLKSIKQTNGKRAIISVLNEYLPARISRWIIRDNNKNIADIKDCDLSEIVRKICDIKIPHHKIKYRGLNSAEIVQGGVCTDEISSKTMESKLCPGLFWAGEVIDIAGDLGGFNLQWAWASGRVAGQNA